MNKFICNECGAVYWDFYPIDDDCPFCKVGHISVAEKDAVITHELRGGM